MFYEVSRSEEKINLVIKYEIIVSKLHNIETWKQSHYFIIYAT